MNQWMLAAVARLEQRGERAAIIDASWKASHALGRIAMLCYYETIDGAGEVNERAKE
jgi:hypothetical protein